MPGRCRIWSSATSPPTHPIGWAGHHHIPTWAGFLTSPSAFLPDLPAHSSCSMPSTWRSGSVGPTAIHHSDQGSQTFGKRCRDAGVRPLSCRGLLPDQRHVRKLLRDPRMRRPVSRRSADGRLRVPIRDGATPPSDICHPSTTNGASYPPLAQIHNRPRNRGNSMTATTRRRKWASSGCLSSDRSIGI